MQRILAKEENERQNTVLTQQIDHQEQIIDGLMMIDRSVDMITPFCTQKTYEGQMDEHFDIKASKVTLHKKILSSAYIHEDGVPDHETLWLTNEKDFIFGEIRWKPYESLGFYLTDLNNSFIRALDKSANQARTLEELNEKVSKIKQLNIPLVKPLVDKHLNICYEIKQRNNMIDVKVCSKLEMQILH